MLSHLSGLKKRRSNFSLNNRLQSSAGRLVSALEGRNPIVKLRTTDLSRMCDHAEDMEEDLFSQM